MLGSQVREIIEISHYFFIIYSVADPDPFHFGQPDPDPFHETGSKRSVKIMKNFHKTQS